MAKVVGSTFDKGLDGWSSPSGNAIWRKDQDGGHLNFNTRGDASGLLLAPSEFLGDKHHYYGGVLSFGLGALDRGEVSVRIVGRDGSSIFGFVGSFVVQAEKTYTFDLKAESFTGGVSRHEVKHVLSDVVSLELDFTGARRTNFYLDDVIMAPPAKAEHALALDRAFSSEDAAIDHRSSFPAGFVDHGTMHAPTAAITCAV
jgi:hypothetical protein